MYPSVERRNTLNYNLLLLLIKFKKKGNFTSPPFFTLFSYPEPRLLSIL